MDEHIIIRKMRYSDLDDLELWKKHIQRAMDERHAGGRTFQYPCQV